MSIIFLRCNEAMHFCKIGGGWVVIKSIPGNSMAVGNPVKLIKKLNNSKKK